jgi:hypothetical protein
MSKPLISTLTAADIDDFFYGDFVGFERSKESSCVVAVVSKHGYKIPVEDWQRGKEMSPGEIRGLVAWAFRRGREAQKEVTDAELCAECPNRRNTHAYQDGYEAGRADALKEQKPSHFELKAGKWYICHRAYCCRADHLTVKEGERFMCEKDGVVKGFIIKEPEKYFIECSAPAPMEDEQKEQKPAEWSEENEKIRKEIMSFILYKAGHLLDEETEHKFIDYLEGQKKQCLAAKSKTSESEDEKMIKAIEHILYENYSDAAVIEGVEIAEIVTWLDKQKEQ